MVGIHLNPYTPLEAAVVRAKLDPQDCVWGVTTNVMPACVFCGRHGRCPPATCHVLKGQILTKLSFLTVQFRFLEVSGRKRMVAMVNAAPFH